jgi:hypothetical protein
MKEDSAVEAIRARVWSRMRRAHLGITSRELNIPLPNLEAFANGTGQLPVDQLERLVKEFFMNTRFDPIADKLINTNLPIKVAYAMPPPREHPDPAVAAAEAAYHKALKASRPEPALYKPEPPVRGNQQPASLKRAGFAE